MTEPSWVGRTLNGRYRIEELLGQGGMASVYRATDPNLRRVVAIKLIHSHLSNNPDFVRRFEAEASAVAQLRHHNIIQVYDFNHDGSTYYIVFEFISGESLQGWLRRLNNEYRKLPVADVVRVAAAVADALDYAHQQELIHRDVKPANVMINMRGEPILMDFGIAKIVGSGQHTATGTIIGTARYMSPEQIRGIQVDARADLYSLGVVLFEMLSGQAPYESDSAMTLMMMHIQDPVPNVLNLRPDVPPGLALVVQRALAKDPQQRYSTAAEMAAALRSALNSPAVIAPSAPALTISLPADPPPGAAVRSAQPAPASVVAAPPIATPASGKRLWAIIGIAVAALLLLPLLIFGAITLAGRAAGPATPGIAAGVTSIAPTVATEANLSGQSTPVPATEAAPTAIAEPTAEPTIDARPTATPLPEISITNVALVGDVYVVQYTVVGFEESLEGMHIHFFFNTTPPREAGRPFSDFFMYAGRSPYAELRLADTPAEATQLCALVANPDHTIQGESGNCFDLPAAPEISSLPSPTVAAASGGSGGSGGSYVVNTPTIAAPAVRISEIRVDNGVYQVAYTTIGFTEQLPGVHIHFFFDVVAPENAGLPHGGPWYVWGGPRPFNGYQVADKPAGAQRMCALVANPDHTVQSASGNCVNLPDVAP